MSERPGAAAFSCLVDLVSAAVGGRALLCSDDFFAPMDNLVRPEPAVFDPDAYTDRGKLMDGWESRRKRVPGHDWCILGLGVPGVIRGVDIDTAYFLGNHPPFASLDATVAPADASPESLRDEATWTRILPETPLKRGAQNLQAVASDTPWTHVRLNIYPDGGVARLRLYGEPRPARADGLQDLACLTNGGRPLACSDMFFSPMTHLVLPDRAAHMGLGWETRRSRPPGEDWIIVALARPGHLDHVIVDTNHFKGNYPDQCALDALYWPDAPAAALVGHPDWTEILAPSKLRMHDARTFPLASGPWTHVRLRIVPDGGVSRLRVLGTPTTDTRADALIHHLNRLAPDDAEATFLRCCGARRWARAMVAARPFTSVTHLNGEADQVWWHLGDGDWREAFTHHPRIGADVGALRQMFAATATWSATEQAGMASASEATIQALADANQRYEQRFGHIFIVCATGLSADAMLARLQARMDHEPWAELRIAAGEQAKITKLRLAKLEV